MKITDLNKDNFKEVECKELGCQELKLIAEQVVKNFVKVEDGIVRYNELDIHFALAHIYLRLATDLFEDVDISDEEVTNILLHSDAINTYLHYDTIEYEYLEVLLHDLIRQIEDENSVYAIAKKAIFHIDEELAKLLIEAEDKIESLSAKEVIETATEAIGTITKSLKREDIDAISSLFKGNKKNELN